MQEMRPYQGPTCARVRQEAEALAQAQRDAQRSQSAARLTQGLALPGPPVVDGEQRQHLQRVGTTRPRSPAARAESGSRAHTGARIGRRTAARSGSDLATDCSWRFLPARAPYVCVYSRATRREPKVKSRSSQSPGGQLARAPEAEDATLERRLAAATDGEDAGSRAAGEGGAATDQRAHRLFIVEPPPWGWRATG